MKTTSIAAAALAVVPLVAGKSYDGYKAYSINSHQSYEAVEAALAGLDWVNMACNDDHDHMDIAIAPESLEAFEALGLDVKLTISNLGEDLAKEANFKKYKRESSSAVHPTSRGPDAT